MKKITAEPSKTVLIITLGFLLTYMFTGWDLALWFAVGTGILGSISSYLAQNIAFLWMKLATLLSFIIPNILLTLIFYLLLFPISILSRLFSKDNNGLILKNTATSLFKESNKTFDNASFEEPW